MKSRALNHVVKSLHRRYQTTLIPSIAADNVFISRHESSDAAVLVSRTSDSLVGRQIAIKDNICTVNLPTTCASALLSQYRSPYDATVVRLLRENGAEIVGKTNMDEFGMGSHSINSSFGVVQNTSADGELRSAGGSSGGSAVAVAKGQCWAAIGTDTGGSVRLPAAYTGVFGFKPSYGLISRWGVVAYANSLDTVGILADSTAKIRDIFHATSMYDARDPTSLKDSTRNRISQENERIRRQDKPLRIGIPLDYNTTELDPSVRRAWRNVLEILQSHGHTLVPVSLPSTKQALSAYYILAPAEASSNLARYDGVRFGRPRGRSDDDAAANASGSTLYSATRDAGLGVEVKRRILLGSYTLSAEALDSHFVQAQRVRRLVQRDFDRVFCAPNPLHDSNDSNSSTDNDGGPVGMGRHEEDGRTGGEGEGRGGGVDILLCPTAPHATPRLADVQALSPVQSYTVDVFTVPASLAGLPAISIPLRQGDDGSGDAAHNSNTNSNIGMQAIGQFGSDELVLTVAALFEAAGLAKAPAVSSSSSSSSVKRAADAVLPLRWFSDDLARSYINMRRYYGGGMMAVQHFGDDKQGRQGHSRGTPLPSRLTEETKRENN